MFIASFLSIHRRSTAASPPADERRSIAVDKFCLIDSILSWSNTCCHMNDRKLHSFMHGHIVNI